MFVPLPKLVGILFTSFISIYVFFRSDISGDTELGVILVLLSLFILILIVKAVLPKVLMLMISLKSFIAKMKDKNTKVRSWTEDKISGSGRLYDLCQSVTLLLLGCLVAAVIQSSSILTSFLVPFAAREVISLDSAYVLTLGINIGTVEA